jgi:hypothetical protein
MPQTLNTLRNINDEVLMSVLSNFQFAKPGLAIGSTVANIAYGALTYTIGGVFYTKNSNAVGVAGWGTQPNNPSTALPANLTMQVQAISTTRIYCVSIDAAGNIRVTQGLTDGFKPDPYPMTVPLGYLKITTDGVTTFTPGTTALNAAGVTVVYTDVCMVPIVEDPALNATEILTRQTVLANQAPVMGV